LDATLDRANTIFRQVKQTGDATVDARLMVNVSDLAYKKTAQLLTGDSSTGVDVDEFLSKCITYMRNGGPLDDQANGAVPRNSRRRTDRHRAESDDDDDDDAAGEASISNCSVAPSASRTTPALPSPLSSLVLSP